MGISGLFQVPWARPFFAVVLVRGDLRGFARRLEVRIRPFKGALDRYGDVMGDGWWVV